MPSFDLATGYVTFKGSFEQYEADIAKAEEKLEALKKADMTGQFKMAAYAAKGVNDQLEKAQKNARRMVEEVKYGKLGLLMRDAAAGFQKFQARMQAFGKVGVGMGAAALGAASVASPLAADTLSGSMKLLTASIGKDFMPMAAQAAAVLQEAARAWNGLNQSVKDSITETVKMTAVAGAGALALVGVGRALSFIAAHPILSAIGAGVGIGSFINARNDRMGNQQFQGLQKEIGGIKISEVLEDGMMRNLRAMPKEEALHEAEKQFKSAWNDYTKKAEASNNYQKGWFGGGWEAGVQLNNDFDGSTQKNLIQQASEAQATLEKTKLRWASLKDDPRVAGGGDALESIAAGATAGGAKGKGYLAGSMGPSSYSSLTDFYRQMNLATTGTSPLESETIKLQREANEIFRQQLEKLGTIEKNSNKAS